MKQQLVGEELINGLYEVKSLLTAMDNVNKQELQIKKQIRSEVDAQNIQIKVQKQNTKRIVHLVILFVVLTLIFAFTTAPTLATPGYQGREKPLTFGAAFIRSIPIAGIYSLVVVVIAGAITFTVQKQKNNAIIKENNRRHEQYQANLKLNKQIIESNKSIQKQIEQFHERKRQISSEYMNNICQWYHEEYAFMEAVDFFIHELDLGTATTLPEAIDNFREAQYRKNVIANQESMINNQATMINNQKIMINKQEIMISKQNEMIRQQMIGNFIAAATLSEVKSMGNDVRNIAANTSKTAGYAADIAQNTRR